MPAERRSAAWRQARVMPNTSRPSAFQASTSGARAVLLPAPATPIATPSRPPVASLVIIARWACHCSAAGSIAGLRARKASAARSICAAGKAPDKSSEAVLASRISSRSWSICSAVVTFQRSLPRSGAPLPHSSATCWPSCTTPRSRKPLITASMSSPGRSPMPATINARAAISRNSWPSSTARRPSSPSSNGRAAR